MGVLNTHGRAAVHRKGSSELLLVAGIHLLQHTGHNSLEGRCRRMSILLAEGHEFRALEIQVVARHLGSFIHKGVFMALIHLQGFRHIEDILVIRGRSGNEAGSDLIHLVSQVVEHALANRAVVQPNTGGVILFTVLEGKVVVHQGIIHTVAAHAVGESVEVGNPDFVLYIGNTEHTPFCESAANIGRAIHFHRLETRSCVLIGDIRSVNVQYKIHPGMYLNGLINGLLQDFSVHILIELDVLGVAGIKKIKIQPGAVADWGLFHVNNQ